MNGDDSVVPNWRYTLSTLKETLEEVLLQLDEGERSEDRVDVRCLEAFDSLDRYLAAVKQDLGL